jgi:uncharacterized BrkB/YihY/UPF0761 family membrane protein
MNNNITKQKPAINLFIILVVTLAVYNVVYGAICYVVGGIAGVIFGASMVLVGGIIGTSFRNKQRNAEK